jgi:hypothetical protein
VVWVSRIRNKNVNAPFSGAPQDRHRPGCAVRCYFRFQLSLRDIEEFLFERGVVVSYESMLDMRYLVPNRRFK